MNEAERHAGIRGMKQRALSFDHVNDQLRVFPVFVLGLTHIKRTASDIAEVFVFGPDGQLSR